jgi:hypothetical protein
MSLPSIRFRIVQPNRKTPLHLRDEAGFCLLECYVSRSRTRRKRYGRQWHRRGIAVGLEPHDRRFRSRRSIVRSPDRQSSRRDGSRRQSCRPRDRRRCCHSAPRIARGCIGGPDQPRPDHACTTRTKRQAVLRNARAHSLSARKSSAQNLSSQSSKTQIRKKSLGPLTPGLAAGNGGRNSADNGDDEFALPRSLQMQIAMHSRQRLYAYCLPSCCLGDKDRHAIKAT